MAAEALRTDQRISPWGWPLIAVRLTVLLTWLIGCLLLHHLVALFSTPNPIPRLFLRGAGMIAGLRVRTHGKRTDERTFLLSNHVSWLDIPALAGSTGTAFVAHEGLARVTLLRWLCKLNDTVFVARERRTSVAEQVRQVRDALTESGALTIFPEGTTSDGTGTLPFKSSLLSALEGDAGVAVQPVWLDYGTETPAIAWIGEESGLHNALRLLARVRPIHLDVHLLTPLSPDERADRKRMARAAHSAIARARAGQHRTPPVTE
ncbi:lysophospholipid acyltransferase family protein [Novosphingobium panipatense]|uniref:Lyso-ornithine lipid acyltransferase n=1 Tax=Novosphingobium panipatense TaxID=428991 RepID=A0ABY1PZK5_9SPHN|nr:lysophospholipid acyltransferase family protein [Novosphingobium panipatense]SMP52715.1 lyso-ornithine lipid acyltransferase [Novosphingobium panipatense]